MGHATEVFLFNYAIYVDDVVQAFRRLLLDGTPASWMHEWLDEYPDDRLRWSGVDLPEYCTYLTAELAPATPFEQVAYPMGGWEHRACRTATCPIRQQCPLHIAQDGRNAERLHTLFIRAVSARCLGEGQYLGRSTTVWLFIDMLEEEGHLNDRLRGLLSCLGLRGYVMGYGWANSDGVQGWLTPQETRELMQLLTAVPLPHYEATFARMRSFLRTNDDGSRTYQHPQASRDELFLSFLRTIAALASQHDHGILWGHDLSVK